MTRSKTQQTRQESQLPRTEHLTDKQASSYRLSIVAMSLTKTVWPQIAMQVFGGAVSTPVWGKWGDAGSPN